MQSKDEPLGVSSEVHTDLNPHDLPLDHPGRPEVEGDASGATGTPAKPRRDEAGLELGG